MTRETAEAVQQTGARLEEARANARRLEEAMLARIAAEMPDRVDELAKGYAQRQPDVAQALGREKLDAMRAELAAEAASIGARFVAAIDEVVWPVGRVNRHSIDQVVFDTFYRKVAGPAVILERYGFKVRPNQYSDVNGVVSPQDLYRQDRLDHLIPALQELGAAEVAHDTAVAADKRANVDDLWG